MEKSGDNMIPGDKRWEKAFMVKRGDLEERNMQADKTK